MYYTDEQIEEVRSRNDIVDIISSYVNLKKKGNSYSACCPFHNEKTPSFHVSREKQMYHCFGCGVGGNAYTFLMEHENMSFPEAVEMLADRAGISLPKQSMSPEAQKQADEKTKIKDMNKTAAVYFHYMLRTEHGKHALEYLKERGLSDETINNFALGYSDVYSDDLYKHMKNKGYSDEELKKAGLIRVDEKYGASDSFRNRVMFPIIDTGSRVIGFGGRVMGDGKPKYINTQDTPAFDKSRNLYGLNIAKKSKRRGIIFCEGYMDVISMHQAGFDNAVASLGTALTPGQVSLIRRCNKDIIYLAYDSDEAGTKATLRALEIIREFEIPVRVISLKPHKDPDELIKAEGAEGLERRMNKALSGIMFEIQNLANNYNQDDPQERTDFQKEAAKRLSLIRDPLERDNYLDSVAKQYNIQRDTLKEAVTKYGTAAENSIDSSVFSNRSNQRNYQEEDENKQLKTERLLITWMINDDRVFNAIKDIIKPDDFFESIYHDIASAMYEQYEKEGAANPAVIMNRFQTSEEHSKAFGIMQQDFDLEIAEEDKLKAITDLVRTVKRRSVIHQLDEANGDLERISSLMKEKAMIDKINIHF